MKKNVIVTIGVLTVITLILVNTQNFAVAPAKRGYEVGSSVENFSLKNVDGKMVSLSDYSDAKGYIVVFTCNTCPYAKMYEQRVEELHQKYADKGYPVIAVNPNDASQKPGDSYDEMISRAESKDYSFPYLYDETQEVTARFGAARTPHTFLVNKENNSMKIAYIGAIDNNPKDASSADQKFVEDAVDALLAGESVTNTFTKAIGCTIKWKEA